MNEKLTNSQRRLVEDNYGLIFDYIRQEGLNCEDAEDWFGTLAIGLCEAAILYDGNGRFDFKSIAYECMKEEANKVITNACEDAMSDAFFYYDVDCPNRDIFF